MTGRTSDSDTDGGIMRQFRRTIAEALDAVLFVATPVGLWLFAPSDPTTWILVGIPGMLACLFAAAVLKTLLVAEEGKR